MISFDRLGYPIRIGAGLLEKAELPPGKHFLVTDRNVAEAGWPDRLSGDYAGRFVLVPGEASKTMATVETLLDAMIESGIGRSDHVVAVGGGMVGDVAGFAASLLKRGCGWVSVPTSLLAQADSAIGGKTGVNTRHGKNLIGTFHSPTLVLIDPDVLATLPAREMRSGYAEVVKYGLIGEPSFFTWCEEHGQALLEGQSGPLQFAVDFSVRAKADHVSGDERDLSGQRALLNFGHSFGHAIEVETEMLHGEAVAIGMAMAFRLSVELGYCASTEAERAIRHLEDVGLPISTDIEPARLAARMRHDKKEGSLVLTRGIGQAFLASGVSYSP